MNTQLSGVGLMVVGGAAGLGVLVLAIVRNRVAVATQPWLEALIAWAFFVLMGVGRGHSGSSTSVAAVGPGTSYGSRCARRG